MKEDKDLKELLQNNLIEETSADFTKKLMQRIKVTSVVNEYTHSLWQDKVFKTIAAAFIIVSMLLLLLNMPLKKLAMSFYWKLEIPSALSLQIIQFLLAFWVVMIINQVLLRRKQRNSVNVLGTKKEFIP